MIGKAMENFHQKSKEKKNPLDEKRGKFQDLMIAIYMIIFIVTCLWEIINRKGNDDNELWLTIIIMIASIIGLSGMGLENRKLLLTFLSYHLLMTLMMACGVVFLIAMLFTEEGMEISKNNANKSFKLKDENWSLSLFYIMLFALLCMKIFVHQNIKKKIKNII